MIVPIEIIYKILDYVNDTKTYLNCRLVCKDWYNKFIDIIEYKNGFGVLKTIFFEDKIEKKYIVTNKLYIKIIFGKYGYYKYEKYLNDNQTKKQVIESKPPFKLKMQNFSSYCYLSKNVDIRKNKIEINKYSIPSCFIL